MCYNFFGTNVVPRNTVKALKGTDKSSHLAKLQK